MRRLLCIAVYQFWLVSNAAAADYETFLQCDPSTEPGHLFVMIQVFRAPQNEKRPDIGMGTFLVRRGETKSLVYKNRLYPAREYHFSVEAHGNVSDPPVVKVRTTIREGSATLFATT